ncbi:MULTISPECIES: DUF6479 family protein [unclassified Streptomyces]|uniref:DUF6479 family protein n=1 Tax=unclassified Streptomyces TaxID=2593676 RepID=UPI0009402E23|nr:DUF6479 family protein [Streptomyces sp. TSRI0281]
MSSDTSDILAAAYAASPGITGLFPLVFGLIVVGVLIAGFVFGRRVRAREPRPPLPEEQPKRPPKGSDRESHEPPEER